MATIPFEAAVEKLQEGAHKAIKTAASKKKAKATAKTSKPKASKAGKARRSNVEVLSSLWPRLFPRLMLR